MKNEEKRPKMKEKHLFLRKFLTQKYLKFSKFWVQGGSKFGLLGNKPADFDLVLRCGYNKQTVKFDFKS